MKKIIATVLATVMILSILATIAIVPTTAAESTDGGDWAVYASAETYEDENGEPRVQAVIRSFDIEKLNTIASV